MPTNKSPRVQVTLTPKTHDAVKRIAHLSDTSKSAVLGEIIEQQAEVLGKLADMLAKVANLKGKLSDHDERALMRSLWDGEHHAVANQQNVMSELDHLQGQISLLSERTAG